MPKRFKECVVKEDGGETRDIIWVEVTQAFPGNRITINHKRWWVTTVGHMTLTRLEIAARLTRTAFADGKRTVAGRLSLRA